MRTSHPYPARSVAAYRPCPAQRYQRYGPHRPEPLQQESVSPSSHSLWSFTQTHQPHQRTRERERERREREADNKRMPLLRRCRCRSLARQAMPPKSSRDKALRKPKASSLKKSPKKTPVSRRRASAARSSASAATATTTTATSASGGTRTRKQPEPRRRTVPVISDSDDSDASDPTDDVEADSESSSSPASSSSSGHRGAGAMSSIEATVVPPSWIRISSDTVNYVELMLHRCRNAIEARGDYRTRDVNRVLAPLIQSYGQREPRVHMAHSMIEADTGCS